ncbi:MAG: thioester domain-containing protein [Oscillospiraceae bacterium]|nr:thioester domain-containing protein [Oscillospiraceae bacterium]
MKPTISNAAKRATCWLAAFSMAAALLPVPARAAETESVSGDGTLESPKITVTQSTTSEAGGTTTVTTTKTEAAGAASSGGEIQRTEITEETVITDSSGAVVKESGSTQGSEVTSGEKTENIEDVVLEFDGLETGKTITSTSTPQDPTVSGDIRDGEDDPEYDQTTVTETPREVSGTLTDAEVTLGDGDIEVGEDIDIGVESLSPSWPERGEEQDLNVWNAALTPDTETPPEGYDFYYSGYTADSTYGVKVANKDGELIDYVDVVQFTLTNPETGEVHTAYCVDLSTGTKDGWWYTMENVADADYYSETDADHIRAIAASGYWGTAEGTGSLTEMKNTLKAVLAENPEALGGLTAQDIDQLTAGEAQVATQMAIWTYGNQIKDEFVLTASNYNGSEHEGMDDPTEAESAAWNRINRITAYLTTLSKPSEEDTQILSPEKFITDVGLTVGSKVEDHANNADSDSTNDAYHADLTFALAVTVTENDDLVVKVIDGSGNVIRTARLAGDDSRTGYGILYPDENGTYTIAGLELIEGANAFDITLEGAQYLEQGVYIYTSESRGEKSSQTFIGMAEGYQAVDLKLKVNFEFSVDEGTVETEHIWRTTWENTPTVPPEETEPEDSTEETAPVEEAETTGTQADVPKTGDSSALWAAMCLLSLGGMILLGRKRTAA